MGKDRWGFAFADPGGSFYTFQKGVVKSGGKTEEVTLFGSASAGGERHGFADVWFHEHFAWEYKGKHKSLDKAYEQLLQYREDLRNPPLLVVCDFDRFIVHTNFNNCVKKRIEFANADLAKPENLAVLRALFENPQALKPEKSPAAVTEEAAAAFAKLAENLRARGAEPHAAAHFLMKMLFCLFAEDTGLLPNNVFTRIVKQGRDELAAVPSSKKAKQRTFPKYVSQLFRAMADGGEVLMESIDHFNGGLFADTDVLELSADDLNILHDACTKDWSSIEPAIIGTLFERSLDPTKRSQLGAHYTSRDDIQTLVEPVLMQPLRREWAEVKEKAEKLRGKRDGLKGKEYAKADKALSTLLANSIHKISTVRVLDPACGSGNFLYVSLNLLKELEKEVYTFAVRCGHNLIRFVSPEQLYGIEINPYAAELARLVVWIGHIQWDKNNGLFRPDDPILKPLQNIREMDAIIKIEPAKTKGGKPIAVEPQWPECEVIVGNPPFLGGNKIRQELGDEYVGCLFALYDERVPAFADLCCYWFDKARVQVGSAKCRRAGLLATQGIRGGVNREVLDRIKGSGGVFFAYSDRPWVLDGANVHISMVGFDNGQERAKSLNGQFVDNINSDLTSGIDVTSAKPLEENDGCCFMGPSPKAPFDLKWKDARAMLEGGNPIGSPNADVIRPLESATDIVKESRWLWTIDFAGNGLESAAKYEVPFEHCKRVVYPVRAPKLESGKQTRREWWQFERPRFELRTAVRGIDRVVVTPELAKHRVFVWRGTEVLCNQQTLVFARSDDYFFGVLHSRFHEVWALRLGTHLETRPRYTPTTCFETFPFPEPPGLNPAPNDQKVRAIGEAAKELDQLRQNWLNPPEWVKEEVLEFPASADGPWKRYVVNPNAKGIGTARYPRLVPKDADCAKELKKRTLTNLYNQRPTWLALAHQKLDAAVAAAYGWPADLKDAEILERLLRLNLERAHVDK